ncbi:MAG: hypothetical protein V2I39_12905 [Erythrobacter sp.]|jgi:hypothetical protein|nr:hypothetical protein [Erythrobacter sp.]
MTAQSTVFPIFLRAEYRESQGFQRFQSDAQRAAQAAKREFAGVSAALDQALSRPRNQAGSLDLGVDEMRRAAQAQQQVALAAREVAEATKRAASANGQFDASMSAATRAAFELANAEERASREMLEQVTALDAVQRELNQTASATDLVSQATRRGQAARGAATGSIRAERTAFVQLGQQMQDVTVQAQLGTNAFVIFSQQVPQAAFALSGLSNSANATKARIGQLATFLAGPWGAAIFAATAVLGPLAARMLDSGDAADEARGKTFDFAEGLDVLSLSAADASSAMDQLSNALRGAIRLQGDFLRGQADIATSSVASLENRIASAQAELAAIERRASVIPLLDRRSGAEIARSGQLERQIAADRAALPGARLAAANAAVAIGQRNVQERLDPNQARINDIDRQIADLNARRRRAVRIDSLDDGIFFSQEQYETELERLVVLRKEAEEAQKAVDRSSRRSGGERSAGAAARRAAREQEQVAQFGERAEERIARLNERFDEQPRLIDQAASATRELDRIIADLQERKPVGFKELVEEAERAKATVEDALVRPVEQVLEASEQRLQIEALLAQGREDEALVLQEILRLEAAIGDLTDEQRETVREQLLFEEQKTREYRVQAALLEQQADVARTVADSLRDVLSGRSTDFVGNIRQALLDLQGARLFEDLFGESFDSLTEELRGNTPQGRANAEYARQVRETAAATETVGAALNTLAETIGQAGQRIATGAANDNFDQTITVTGKTAEVEVTRRSIEEIAERLAEGIVTPLTAELEDLLGPQFAAQLGTVVSGALAGLIRGGEPGAVLGGLEGLSKELFGADSGLTKTLGGALGGAQTGTTVNALSEALGLGGSATGAQIGGAIGSVIPIPGGDIIGSLVGNFLGSLLGGTRRGSAIIGASGSGLDVTGFFGNSSSRKDAAAGLAASVLDAIDRIAEELGATVNAGAGRVSIGVRKDNFRVDPQGRGFTKLSAGAVDFGDDAEAAIRFAVRDLIEDGVIGGLEAAEARLLRAGDDIEAALRDVLEFRSVFDRLREIRDPLGFAIDELNSEFEGLIELFERAGASSEQFASLEELYSIERAELIRETTDRVAGSLRDLLADLTIGDSGLSLRTRQANALGDFNGLAARVAAGDSTAFDEFSEVSRQLLEIERELFGSTESYFDRLAQITALTEQAIEGQANVTSIGTGAPSPFDDRAEINRSIDNQTSELGARLDRLNNNFEAYASARLAAGGGGKATFPGFYMNF